MHKFVKDGFMLTCGSMLMAMGIYFFKFPNNFATGGISGLSVILGRVVPGISPGTFMLVINMALLAVGFFAVGKGFTGRTVYCCVVNSLVVWALERIYPMSAPFTSQPLMELVFEILLTAVGAAILFNLDASTGGTDIIAMIIKKYSSLNIGTALLVSDSLIAASTIFIFGVETFLFCVLGLMLKGFMVDTVIDGMNLCKYFTIVTTKPEEISDFIINVLHHTATTVEGEGAFSGEKRRLVMVACRRNEALMLKKAVHRLDAHAFMFITNTSEIVGKGFRSV
jgi:uncharacterized membrane-anchored protein YitT (DUF2179 family)